MIHPFFSIQRIGKPGNPHMRRPLETNAENAGSLPAKSPYISEPDTVGKAVEHFAWLGLSPTKTMLSASLPLSIPKQFCKNSRLVDFLSYWRDIDALLVPYGSGSKRNQ